MIGIDAAKSPNNTAGLRNVIQYDLLLMEFSYLKIVIRPALIYTGFFLTIIFKTSRILRKCHSEHSEESYEEFSSRYSSRFAGLNMTNPNFSKCSNFYFLGFQPSRPIIALVKTKSEKWAKYSKDD